MTKGNVPQEAALVCIYILVAEERPNTTKLLRYLRVERGHVVYRRTLIEGMPDEEAFVQELDSMSNVHNMPVDDSLAKLCYIFPLGISNPIVINGPANLQAWN